MATGTIPQPAGVQNRIPSVTANFLALGNTPTAESPYVFPNDGYIVLYCNDADHVGRIHVTGADSENSYIQLGNTVGRFALFVRKGMSCYMEGSTPNTARFIQLT